MQVRSIPEQPIPTLLDPGSVVWGGGKSETVKLMGTPVGLQPTELIRVAWMERPIGAVGEVSVQAVSDGVTLAFRLEWADATQNSVMGDTTSFADAAAVLLPAKAESVLMTMGAPGAAVNGWYWRADDPESGREVVAEGLGTTRTLESGAVKASGRWSSGRWQVVIARSLQSPGPDPVAQLTSGQDTRFGVAIWEGGSGERAGIKAFSGDWQTLALPQAGR
jgi:DMSO reductase family type II enzyme heme b subunit